MLTTTNRSGVSTRLAQTVTAYVVRWHKKNCAPPPKAPLLGLPVTLTEYGRLKNLVALYLACGCTLRSEKFVVVGTPSLHLWEWSTVKAYLFLTWVTMPNLVKGYERIQPVSKYLGALRPLTVGRGAWLVPWKHDFPTWVNMPNLVVVGQTVRAYVRRSTEELSHSSTVFQGHPRSSKLIWIDGVPDLE